MAPWTGVHAIELVGSCTRGRGTKRGLGASEQAQSPNANTQGASRLEDRTNTGDGKKGARCLVTRFLDPCLDWLLQIRLFVA